MPSKYAMFFIALGSSALAFLLGILLLFLFLTPRSVGSPFLLMWKDGLWIFHLLLACSATFLAFRSVRAWFEYE